MTAGQLVLLAPLGTDIYLASVPDVALDLDTSAAAVQFTLAGFMVGLAAGPLVIGPISDRYGRYRLLVVGILALTVSSVLRALAPSIGILIAARIYSLLSVIMGVAPIVAPILGGLIQQWASWWAAFWVMLAISAAVVTAAVSIGSRVSRRPATAVRQLLRPL